MTASGKEETQKAMETLKERGKPMLVTNPGMVLYVQRRTTPYKCTARLQQDDKNVIESVTKKSMCSYNLMLLLHQTFRKCPIYWRNNGTSSVGS